MGDLGPVVGESACDRLAGACLSSVHRFTSERIMGVLGYLGFIWACFCFHLFFLISEKSVWSLSGWAKREHLRTPRRRPRMQAERFIGMHTQHWRSIFFFYKSRSPRSII